MKTFVRIDEYNDLMDVITLAEEKMKKAKELLEKIKALKAQEDAALDTWQQELETVAGRVQDINSRLANHD